MAYLNHKFDRLGYGNILQTVVDYDAVNSDDRVRSLKKGKDSDRRVLLINRPNKIVTENGIIIKVNGEGKPKLWPEPGYAGRTCDGAYDEDGIPRETWPTREQAEETWPQDTKDSREFATDAVSYAYARNEGEGKAVVYRWFFSRADGRFDLFACRNPRNGNDGVGRSPVSR